MQVAILLYPGFTALDVMGPYEVLARLPGAQVTFVTERPGLVANDLGAVAIDVAAGLHDVPAPDVVLVGGGPGQAAMMSDGAAHEWLRCVDRTSTWTTSVCTGSLILAAAGLLSGRRATSHWLALPALAQHGARPTADRVVIDGHYATAAGVSSGIDMALTLAGRMLGDEAAQTVQLIIEYAPRPPYDAGSLASAPPAVIDRARAVLAGRFSDETG